VVPQDDGYRNRGVGGRDYIESEYGSQKATRAFFLSEF